MITPNHIQIEVVKGLCSVNCIMCPINNWDLEPMIMGFDDYSKIMDKVSVHRDAIRFLTLHGRGEPLLDSGLCDKIRLSRMVLQEDTSIGFASNCTELEPELSRKLIDSGLDLIICSVDGTDAETHESIRVGTNYEQVINSIKSFISIRNEIDAKTRVMLRFIRQEKNFTQWESFQNYWADFIDETKKDSIVKFDVHNWGKQSENFTLGGCNLTIDKPLICSDLYERFIIQCDGSIGFCCALEDDYHDLSLGNIYENSLVQIYNGKMFCHYRQEMEAGRIFDLELCKNCTIPLSRYKERGSYKVES